MKKEIKICLPVYKIVYSMIFMLILSLVRGISFTEGIGLAMEGPVALLAVIFCADTYLVEVQSKRSDVFKLYRWQKQVFAVFRRLLIQIIYLVGISAVGYWLFYWQKPVRLEPSTSSAVLFGIYSIAVIVSILFWSTFSLVVSNLFRNIWAGIGSVFLIWIFLLSKGGDDLLGKWNLFSYTFRKLEAVGDFSWLCGKLVSLVLTVILMALVPVILKKRG